MWSLGGDLVSKVGVLALTLIAARSLHPIEFGVFVGLFAIVSVAAGVWDLGVSSLLTREVAAGRVSEGHAAHRALVIRGRTVPIMVLAFGAGLAILSHAHPLSSLAVAGFGTASVLVGLHAIPLGILRGQLRFRAAAIAYAAGRWLTPGLSLLTFVEGTASRRLETFALALMLGEAMTLVIATIAVRTRSVPSRVQPEPQATISIRAALPFATTSLLALVYNRLDVVLLAALSTAEQLARYAPASRLQDALFLLPTAIGSVALPVIANAWSRPGGQAYVQRLVRRLTLASLAAALPVTVVSVVFAPEIIRVVLGSDYLGTVTPMRVLVCFLPFAAASAPLIAALTGTGHAIDATKVFVVAFTIAIGLHFCLDWWWGATGAAVASLSRDPGALALAFLLLLRIGIRSFPLRPALRDPSPSP